MSEITKILLDESEMPKHMYLAGKIEDYEYPSEKVAESLKKLPEVSPV